MTQRHHDGEPEHDWIERDLAGSRQTLGVGGQQRAKSSEPERRAQHAADQRQHDAFGQKLTQQPPAAGAERRTNRELALPRLGAREHQVRQIGARDEQHEHDGPLQHPQRRSQAANQIVVQPIEAEPMRVGVRHVARSGLEWPLHEHRFEIDPGLLQAHVVFQPADEVQKVSAAPAWIRGVEGQRQPDLDALIVHVVARRHDADNARGRAIDRHDPPDD